MSIHPRFAPRSRLVCCAHVHTQAHTEGCRRIPTSGVQASDLRKCRIVAGHRTDLHGFKSRHSPKETRWSGHSSGPARFAFTQDLRINPLTRCRYTHHARCMNTTQTIPVGPRGHGGNGYFACWTTGTSRRPGRSWECDCRAKAPAYATHADAIDGLLAHMAAHKALGQRVVSR